MGEGKGRRMGKEGSERERGLLSWKPVDSSKGQRGWLYETAVSSVETSHTDASFAESNKPLEEVCAGFGSQAALVSGSSTLQLCL